MKKICLIPAVFILFFLSCKKESAVKDSDAGSDPSLQFLNNTISDPYNENGFYIKGNFNGHDICFATTDYEYNDPFFADTFMNAYFVYHDHDSITNDNLNLLRQNTDHSIMIGFFCGQTHIKDRSFPYAQPHPDLEQCEFTEMQFINQRSGSSAGQNSPQDNYTFLGYTGFGINLTFTSLSPDNIIEGKFDGTIRTNTGSSITVKDGKFRIKFVVDDVFVNTGGKTFLTIRDPASIQKLIRKSVPQ